MWKKIGNISFLIVFLMHFSLLAEEVQVEASVNSDEIGLNDTLIYTLTISCGFNSEPSQIKFPDFQGFKKLSQSESSSMNIVIGGGQTFSKIKTYDIQLLPNKTGIIEIKPAVVVLKGKVYQTKSLKVNVLPASKSTQQRNRGGSLKKFIQSPFDIDEIPDPVQIKDNDIMLQAVVDKKSVYIGEEVVFSVFLYSAIPIYEIEQFSIPKFENAWVEDIYTPQRFTSEQKYVGNKMYNVYLLRRKAVFPNKSGIYEIEPSSILLNVVSGFNKKRINRNTEPIKIDVKPLPEKEMPKDFPVYNVGEYKISYSLSPNIQPMDKPFTLKILVEGKGNINSFSIPKLKDNPELRFYDPVVKTDIQTDNKIFGGKRSYEYLIFAKRKGKILLPAFDIVYFRPDTATYEKVSISNLSIEATEPENLQSVMKRSTTSSATDRGYSIRFVNNVKDDSLVFKFSTFILLTLIFPGIYLIIRLSDLGKSLYFYLGFDSEISRRRRRLKRYISEAERYYASKDLSNYISNVYLALVELLMLRYGLNIKGTIRENLHKDLKDKGVRDEVIQDLDTILNVYDFVKFSKTDSYSFNISEIKEKFNLIIKECGE